LPGEPPVFGLGEQAMQDEAEHRRWVMPEVGVDRPSCPDRRPLK
jgi:hypothetical protein